VTVGVSPWRGRRAVRRPWRGGTRGGGGARPARVKEEKEARVGRVDRKAE
jgi:hypothetical protein